MNSISILSSSSTLPNHYAWGNLRSAYKNINYGSYGDWINDLSKLDTNSDALILIFFQDFFDLDGEHSNTEQILQIIGYALEDRLKRTTRPTYFFYSNYYVRSLLDRAKNPSLTSNFDNCLFELLDRLLANYPNFYRINLTEIFFQEGIEKFYDDRNWYLMRSRLSSLGVQKISQSLVELVNIGSSQPKKVLVLDCDNTLWGGVIGEDGIGGIKLGEDGLGAAFYDFQKAIKEVSSKGILLALASKNIENDVLMVLNNHDSMLIKADDLVSWRINWNEKSQNIEDIANDLDLGLESFVFWDDNPIERDRVKRAHPMVMVVEPPLEVEKWPNYLRSLSGLSRTRVTEDDLKKNQQYKSRANFIRAKTSATDELGYLKSIQLMPEIMTINASNLGRAAQLCAKTNQFNVSLRRHNEADIEVFSSREDCMVSLVRLRDIYGDHGVTAFFASKKLSSLFFLIHF